MPQVHLRNLVIFINIIIIFSSKGKGEKSSTSWIMCLCLLTIFIIQVIFLDASVFITSHIHLSFFLFCKGGVHFF